MTFPDNPSRDETTAEELVEELAEDVARDNPDDMRATGAAATPEEISHQLGSDEPQAEKASHDPYAVWKLRDYRLYAIGGFIATLGSEMRSVAVMWELYERTRDPLALGYVGLAEFVPALLLALPAGHLADRYNRQHIMLASYLISALVSIGLMVLSLQQGPLFLFYACLVLGAIARAINDPARTSLLPLLVPRHLLSNAVTWNTSRWQIGAVTGPALGGLVIAATQSAAARSDSAGLVNTGANGAAVVYLLDAVAVLIFMAFLASLRPRKQERDASHKDGMTVESLLAGLAFVRRNKVILATITLDMFAVLLGGVTALLPVFQKEILNVGPTQLGYLRAAPAVGAMCMALSLTYMPPMRRAGLTLLWAVAGFGIATIVFGLSRNLYLSLLMLFLIGALDNISVVVRQTLVQVLTPDAMRGRVSAVNSVFIGTSNELGAFESGFAAAHFGPVAAVVGGGIGTVLVVGVIAYIWPQVRQLRALNEPVP